MQGEKRNRLSGINKIRNNKRDISHLILAGAFFVYGIGKGVVTAETYRGKPGFLQQREYS